ncbi:Sds3-like-domain-containing protein [Diplogelasinospora grovesii]|uniref:Sds3-like-domain-containing protein n=1 Tax=Diplogelasinospora grovesii TaxID=303347 RepID=A0AAN6NI78_9PEZI|nr:Sds3-like-domain-containing protein [Diplogelasinospora grovesii]
MATSDSTMVDAPAKNVGRANSPPPTQSKRDKRRQMLAERLASLTEKCSRDRDQSYREQLQKIQIDTSLVMRIDPYVDRPLDGFEEDQKKLAQLNGDADDHQGPRTLLEMAGPKFSKWMENVQDLVEQRDYTLTKYKFDFEKKTSEYLSTQAYKIETANREHKALASTLRDRLINTITSKKYRLNKEKEALEISDASALLLHPNQFSITNPASPGGTHSKRATRLRRDAEEIPGMDGRKRKRNNNNDDDGSPAPQRRALDPSSTTPLWQTDRITNRKTTGPVYSIDKLFTDKELSMAYNAAAVAAHKYLLTHKPKINEHGQVISSPSGSDSGSGDQDEQDGSDSVPSAPMMERNVSHATRSARGGANNPNFSDNQLMGMEALANFNFPGNFERMVAADPKLPPTFPSQYVKGHAKQSDFNTPTALGADDTNNDLMVMNALRQYNDEHGVGANFSTENGSRKLLEAVSEPVRNQRFVTYLQGDRPNENLVRKNLGLPLVVEPEHRSNDLPPNLGPDVLGTPSKTGRSGTPMGQSPAKGLGGPTSAPALGGVSMSRQSSANGAAMSRSSSRKGRATRAG